MDIIIWVLKPVLFIFSQQYIDKYFHPKQPPNLVTILQVHVVI